MIILSTLRLHLRQLEVTDADFIYDLLNSPGWKAYIGDRKINTIAAAEAYLQSKILPVYEKFGFGFYLMETRNPIERVGICGLIQRAGLEDVDIGYALLPDYEHQGFAFEAARAVLDYGLTIHQLKRIVAITTHENVRSITLLNKLGLEFIKMITLPDDDEPLMLFSTKITKSDKGSHENTQ